MPRFDELDGKKSAVARVAVVAAGVVSPLGLGLRETQAALKANKDCVLPITNFDVSKCRCRTAGQVPDEELTHRSDRQKDRRLHRASRMMITALGELREQDRQFNPELTVIG